MQSDSGDSPAAGIETDGLDPVDRAWQQSRFAGAPLVFGVIGVVVSPLLLGLALGPIAVRTGIDLWRNGTRRVAVPAGIAVGIAATLLSIAAAVAWGALLASVLVGRELMRDTERWRGRTLDSVSLVVRSESGLRSEMVLGPPVGSDRLLMLFVDVSTKPSALAAEGLARALAAAGEASATVLIVDRANTQNEVLEWCRSIGLTNALVFESVVTGVLPTGPSTPKSPLPEAPLPGAPLPEPLDGIAALPTVVLIDGNRQIEAALVGARTDTEWRQLLQSAPER